MAKGVTQQKRGKGAKSKDGRPARTRYQTYTYGPRRAAKLARHITANPLDEQAKQVQADRIAGVTRGGGDAT